MQNFFCIQALFLFGCLLCVRKLLLCRRALHIKNLLLLCCRNGHGKDGKAVRGKGDLAVLRVDIEIAHLFYAHIVHGNGRGIRRRSNRGAQLLPKGQVGHAGIFGQAVGWEGKGDPNRAVRLTLHLLLPCRQEGKIEIASRPLRIQRSGIGGIRIAARIRVQFRYGKNSRIRDSLGAFKIRPGHNIRIIGGAVVVGTGRRDSRRCNRRLFRLRRNEVLLQSRDRVTLGRQLLRNWGLTRSGRLLRHELRICQDRLPFDRRRQPLLLVRKPLSRNLLLTLLLRTCKRRVSLVLLRHDRLLGCSVREFLRFRYDLHGRIRRP